MNSPPAVVKQPGRLAVTFTALGYPKYRTWFRGQIFTFFGAWMQSTALGFLLFELTHSAAWLGWFAFANGLPVWLFMLLGGALADRHPKRLIMLVTNSLLMGLAAGLTVLSFRGLVEPWHILVLGFLLGTANAFDAPARQAFVSELVPREDLGNAIALNGAMFNTATAFGPALGGLIYAGLGPAWCFAVNALAYIGILASLKVLRVDENRGAERRGVFESLKLGFGLIRRSRDMLSVLLIMGSAAFFGLSLVGLFPAWSVLILAGDARTNGFLQSFRGLGALLGALAIASLGRYRRRARLVTAAAFVNPLFLALFALAAAQPAAFSAIFAVGLVQIVIFNLCNSLTQSLAPDDLRGTVMGIYTMIFMGSYPLGSLAAGVVSDSIGLVAAFLASAAACLLAAAVLRLANRGFSALEA